MLEDQDLLNLIKDKYNKIWLYVLQIVYVIQLEHQIAMKMEEYANADSLIQEKIVALAKMDIQKTLKLENVTHQEHAHN